MDYKQNGAGITTNVTGTTSHDRATNIINLYSFLETVPYLNLTDFSDKGYSTLGKRFYLSTGELKQLVNEFKQKGRRK